ncbi:MAG: DUF2442 domain-containing protein [Chlorobiaceae bacterium]|nr:DUF2442 domain-containing protein [Chlorobiaceae bacterium]
MNPRVQHVGAMADYTLKIRFVNGEEGFYDCRPLLDFGLFRELRDPTCFRQVAVTGGTVTWPHEQDICPDTLYLEARKSAGGRSSDSRDPDGDKSANGR